MITSIARQSIILKVFWHIGGCRYGANAAFGGNTKTDRKR